MKYDFDEIVPRRGSGCIKYDSVPEDVIPLWVADMDFRTPDFVIDAIQKRLECPVLGYPKVPDNYYRVVSRWVSRLHGWNVNPDHIRYIPGIVKGIGLAQCCLFNGGTKVVIQPPVYHPFRIVSEKNGNEVIFNPLKPVCREGRITGYEMDFDHLEKCFEQGARLMVISNPQNPSGVCWDRETLRKLAHMACEHGVVVISDEIHAEMALKGYTHTPFASVSEEAARCSITFMAPSKTFNIAGIVSSYAIVPDEKLREKFFTFLDANEIDYPSIFSIEATMAAYTKGRDWRRQMLSYVEKNIDFVCRYLGKYIPQIVPMRPQASFLVWLDCRALGLSRRKLMRLLKKKAGIFLNDGAMFGPGGEGFVRLNVGCPRSVLADALERLRAAVDSLDA